MTPWLARSICALAFACASSAFAGTGAAPPAAAKKPAAAPAAQPATDPFIAQSAKFWGDWKSTQASPDYAKLQAAVGRAPSPPPSTAPDTPRVQRVLDVAITKPAEAAAVLSKASTATHDRVSSGAVDTVLNMITSPQTREAAAPLVAPAAQARVQTMNANLSTGIAGLPGIYLGDNASQGGERAPMPSGYEPVSGGASSCPSR